MSDIDKKLEQALKAGSKAGIPKLDLSEYKGDPRNTGKDTIDLPVPSPSPHGHT